MKSSIAPTKDPQAVSRYHAWYAGKRGAWMSAVEAASLLRLGDIGPGTRLLDVGCGSGWFSRRFAAHGAAVVAMDRDPEMLAGMRAGRRAATDLPMVQADMRRLPFAARSFDVVAAVTSLCFAVDEAATLRELLRVARRRVLLGLLQRRSLLHFCKRRSPSYAGARWHTRAELLALLHGMPDVGAVTMETHLFWPGGAGLGGALERLPGLRERWGAFLAVAIDRAEH